MTQDLENPKSENVLYGPFSLSPNLFFWHSVLVCFLLLWWTSMGKQLGEELVYFSLQVIVCYQGMQKQGLKGGVGSRNHGGMLLLGSLSGSHSATFLTELRPTCPGMAMPVVDWPFQLKWTIKKMPHRHDHTPIQGRKFHNWGSFFPGVLSWQPKLAITQLYYFLKYVSCVQDIIIIADVQP